MSFSGTPVSGFADIYKITGPSVLLQPTDFPNEAQERVYLTGHWMAGMNGTDHLQGGKRVEEYVMTDDGSTAQNTLPGAVRTVDDPQVMQQLTAEWKLTEDHMSWNMIMRALNEGGGSTEAKYQQFKSEAAKSERRLATSYCNKFESDWFAQPDTTTMDGTSVSSVNPYPFWLYVNEYGSDGTTIFDATQPQYPNSSALPNGFSTIHGVDPVVQKWYRPWQIPYNQTVDNTTVNPGGLDFIAGMRRAIGLTQYKPLPWKPNASTLNDPVNNPDYVIPCSNNGGAFVHSLAASNSNFFRTDPRDPYFPAISFAGIPFLECSQMDKAKVFPTSAHTAPVVGAGVTESAAAVAGPRFPLISKKWIRWFMHAQFNFYMWDAKYPARQWDTEIHPVSTLHNRMCLSRRKLAIVFPNTTIAGFHA